MNLSDHSDYDTVLSRAKLYYGKNVKLLQSTRKSKKNINYMIITKNPITIVLIDSLENMDCPSNYL